MQIKSHPFGAARINTVSVLLKRPCGELVEPRKDHERSATGLIREKIVTSRKHDPARFNTFDHFGRPCAEPHTSAEDIALLIAKRYRKQYLNLRPSDCRRSRVPLLEKSHRRRGRFLQKHHERCRLRIQRIEAISLHMTNEAVLQFFRLPDTVGIPTLVVPKSNHEELTLPHFDRFHKQDNSKSGTKSVAFDFQNLDELVEIFGAVAPASKMEVALRKLLGYDELVLVRGAVHRLLDLFKRWALRKRCVVRNPAKYTFTSGVAR